MSETTPHGQGTLNLGTAPIGRLLWHYAIPSIVGMSVNVLYSVVDRIFIAQGVNSLALSGLAVTMPLMTFLQAFGVLIGAGAASRISILLGQKRRDDAEKLLGNAFILSIILSIITITACMVFGRPLLREFGASEASLPYAMEYMSIVVPGNIFANLTFSYNAVMRATGYPKKAMYTMLIGAVLNTILDPIFIFGFKWGISGAAWATVISMFVGMIWVLRHFMRKDSFLRIRPKFFKLHWEYIISIVGIGVSPFSIQLCFSLINTIKNRQLYAFGQQSAGSFYSGDLAVASFGIVSSIAMLILMTIFGISQGTQPIIGYNYGAGNWDRVRKTYRISSIMNVIIGFVGAVIAYFFADALARIFTPDRQLVAVAAHAISIELLATWAVGMQITSVQFFQSLGSVWRSLILSLSRQVLFLIPLVLILPHYFGVDGVWIASPVADILSAILSLIFVIIFFRKMRDKALTDQVRSEYYKGS